MQAGDSKQGTNKWPCLDLFKNFVRIGIRAAISGSGTSSILE